MIKQLYALFLACLLLISPAALAETKVSVIGASDTALPEMITDLNIEWLPSAPGFRCLMTWKANGNDYEAVINGLEEKLTDNQLSQLLYAWNTRSRAVIEDAVVDAEKYTNRLSWNTGDWLVTDTEERQREMWGDSSMCWAATTANMLWGTGWAQKAINPLTGDVFASEDEVFELFKRHFLNDGGWSDHGVRWFFTGEKGELDLRERWDDSHHTRIDGFNPNDYLHGTLNQNNPASTEPATMEEFVSIARRMKDGAMVGMSVGFNEEYYHMPGDENDNVWWSVQLGSFVRSKVLDASEEDCRYGSYCFDDNGNAMPLIEGEDGIFTDETGNEVDRLWVLNGYLYNYEGTWWRAEPFGEDGLLVGIEIPVSEDEFDHNEVYQPKSAPHQHAITLTGYVMNLSAADPGNKIEAMFIANSDDHGALWHIYPDTPDSAHRPDIYQMYPVSVQVCEEGVEGRTLCLEQFMAHNLTMINNMVALDAAE